MSAAGWLAAAGGRCCPPPAGLAHQQLAWHSIVVRRPGRALSFTPLQADRGRARSFTPAAAKLATLLARDPHLPHPCRPTCCRRTEDGYAIYSEAELGFGKGGGDTDKCPFDCDCCF